MLSCPQHVWDQIGKDPTAHPLRRMSGGRALCAAIWRNWSKNPQNNTKPGSHRARFETRRDVLRRNFLRSTMATRIRTGVATTYENISSKQCDAKLHRKSRSVCRRRSRILGGSSGVLTPGGALSPKCAQNRGFPWNCLKTAWCWRNLGGKVGARVPRPPGSTTCVARPLAPRDLNVSNCAGMTVFWTRILSAFCSPTMETRRGFLTLTNHTAGTQDEVCRDHLMHLCSLLCLYSQTQTIYPEESFFPLCGWGLRREGMSPSAPTRGCHSV